MKLTSSGNAITSAKPTEMDGNWAPVASCRLFAHRRTKTAATMPSTNVMATNQKSGCRIGRGVDRPFTLRKMTSQRLRLSFGFGSATNTPPYQNTSWSSSGTLRTASI
jgi:hypothetical protein